MELRTPLFCKRGRSSWHGSGEQRRGGESAITLRTHYISFASHDISRCGAFGLVVERGKYMSYSAGVEAVVEQSNLHRTLNGVAGYTAHRLSYESPRERRNSDGHGDQNHSQDRRSSKS